MTDGVSGNRRSRGRLPQRACHFRVLACALRALRACAARRAQRRGAPPQRAARVRVSADPRAPRRGGGERGTWTYHPQRACHFRVLACALRALRACAARRAQRRGAPPLRAARVRVSADPRAPRCGGGERGTGTYHSHHHLRACVRACGLACAKSPRLARCTPPRSCSSASRDRADRAATHLDGAGRREGRSAVTQWVTRGLSALHKQPRPPLQCDKDKAAEKPIARHVGNGMEGASRVMGTLARNSFHNE